MFYKNAFSSLRTVFILVASCVAVMDVNAATIEFLPGLAIQHTSGTGGTFATDYVEVDGYRFETFQGHVLSINTYTDSVRNHGGLWDGSAFGVASPITISRIDGQAFSMSGMSFLEHAGFACFQNFCGLDIITLHGYTPGSSTAFTTTVPTDGYNNTYEFFNPLAADARFSNVSKVIFNNTDAFLLDSVTLNSVPVPAAGWLLGSGLLALIYRARRKVINT